MRYGLAIFVVLWLATSSLAEDILYNRDIRPILSDKCFPCHGPDAKNRQAELRFDLPESALALRDGRRAIVPGDLQTSELVRRVTSRDPDEQMPPPSSGHKLTANEIDLLGKWIAGGAKWEKHWSFIPPVRPTLPAVGTSRDLRQPLDTFIVSRLEKQNLAPSPTADKPALLRRASFDLMGLPPTVAEVADFASNKSPDAYEQALDRLFASPRYGERMAGPWLDAARYADTSGYQSDGERYMWRWRDWVIDAYNRGMPFHQFTIEQIAGDLLPKPTLDQKIATGFHRNHRGNAEGGIIPEEYAAEYVADRVETTGTVWLGLTIGCARCHDHKFDPLPTREFYQLFAFFNNVPEKGRAVKFGNSPPFIKAPTQQQQAEHSRIGTDFFTYQRRWLGVKEEAEREQRQWELQRAELPDHFYPDHALVKNWPVDDKPFAGDRVIEAGDIADFGYLDKFTLSAWVRLDDERGGGTIISRMTDVPEGDGYQLAIVNGKLQLNLVKRWLDDSTRVQTQMQIWPQRWVHVAATYDGSRTAAGIRLWIDGSLRETEVLLDELNQPFNTKQPVRIGGGGGPAAKFRGQLKDVRIDATDLGYYDTIAWLGAKETLSEIHAIEPRRRTRGQKTKLQMYFLTHAASNAIRNAHVQNETAFHKMRGFDDSLPTVMVMEEMKEPRETHILLRGQYDQPGERVTYGVPAALSAFPKDAPKNRLGLAQWLVAKDHPLTSRVQVNRIWQLHFGIGLVKTAEDFGSQGEWPSHPELLDWLAIEFPAHGWDVKWLQRQLLTSSTYRQQSRTTAALAERDPENRLLARGPSERLSAEQIRDQALYASGLLVEQIGGPSVKPLQPPGLWKELTGAADYESGSGADLYRRSLYTFWKRTIAPPNMVALDAPSREFCTVRTSRTNTPLQALTLLNETTFAGAAESLAKRALAKPAQSDGERIVWAFQACTSRTPQYQEVAILLQGLEKQRALNPVNEQAAFTAVMRVLLNLDETLHKN